MPPKVLLSTTVRWPSAPRIAEAFASVGAEVEALCPGHAVLGLSRYISRHHGYDPLRGAASLRRAIRSASPNIVVPLDDRAALQLAALQDESDLAGLSETSLGNPAAYAALMSRTELISAAQACGVAAPATHAVASEDDVEHVLREIGLPAVLKSDHSWGGEGVVVVRTHLEAREAHAHFAHRSSRLRSLARALKRRDAHYLHDVLRLQVPRLSLQRFVAGTPATTSFACWRGRVLAALHFDVLVSEGSGPACVVRRVACPQMAVAADRLAAHFQLSGLHGFDFLRDGDGNVHLIESNPRAPQTSHLALDVDLMAALLSAVVGTPFPSRAAVTTKDVIALFPQEWSRDPASSWLKSAHHDVPWNDPEVLRACLTRRGPNHRQPPGALPNFEAAPAP